MIIEYETRYLCISIYIILHHVISYQNILIYNFYCQGFNISYLRRVASKVSETYIRDVSSMLWNYAFLFAFPTCVLWYCSRLKRMRTKESANYYKFYDTFHCIAYPDNIFCNVGRILIHSNVKCHYLNKYIRFYPSRTGYF